MKNIKLKIKKINEQIKILKARKARLINEASHDEYPEICALMEQLAKQTADYLGDVLRKSHRITDSAIAFGWTVADLAKRGEEFTFPEEIVDRVFDGDYPDFEDYFMKVAEEEDLVADIDDLPREVGALQMIGDEILDDHEWAFDEAVAADGAAGEDMYSCILDNFTSPYQYYWINIWKNLV